MLEMSPVLEFVISDTSRPFRLSPSSGFTRTSSAVRGGRMTDLRYFLAGRELREKFQRTDRHGVMSSFRLLPWPGPLNLWGDIVSKYLERGLTGHYLCWRSWRKLSRTFTTTP